MRHVLLVGFLLFLLKGRSQENSVTLSGSVKGAGSKTPVPFANIVIRFGSDSAFVTGTVTDDAGKFVLAQIKPGHYLIECSSIGFQPKRDKLYVGGMSPFLSLKSIELYEDTAGLQEIEVSAKQDEVRGAMDRKVYDVESNISQSGGSVLQAMQNLPGVTVQDGKVQLRGNDRVTVLIDGKQTALTGFGSQYGLDNIPASSIEKIEIIHNPGSKYDVNGSAGIINIILKKDEKEGLNGKVGLAGGLGALWEKHPNLPGVGPQYQRTPKVNPSLWLNYRRRKVNVFLQSDYLYTQTLNKNEFVTRTYDDGTIIRQQTRRNRNTHFTNAKVGVDWTPNDRNTLTLSGLFGSEKIIDHGEEPFYNNELTELYRFWKFLEDELKTTYMAQAGWQHKFSEPGHQLNLGFNYTFHRENEKYYFNNILPSFTGQDAFKLLSDEQVLDFNLDYQKPLRYGRIEGGLKFRKRDIPTNMLFIPGLNSALDTNAGGWANYRELIPALYGNYVFETERVEAELGLRLEYVDLKYEVNPQHNTYKSDGYHYQQPFPNLRLAYKFNERNRISFFYNRRVDRPNEVDIRIFPKYDDAEIIKVGNPGLKPMFTNAFELGYKTSWNKGYLYAAAFHKISNGTITRISTTVPGSKLIYAIFQNAGLSYNTGLEVILSHKLADWYTANLSANVYRNFIDSFSVDLKYPQAHTFSASSQEIVSGNLKLNNFFKINGNWEAQLSAVYLAKDIVPQGKTGPRFSLDAGIKRKVQKGRGEFFLNATDLLNTMIIRREITGDGFHYTSADYYETQVIRVGYSMKF